MNNQGINSLAPISARYTAQAVEVVSLMCAAHLYVACQALDLRVLHNTLLDALDKTISTAAHEVFGHLSQTDRDQLITTLTRAARDSWARSSRETCSIEAKCYQKP